MAAKTPSPRKEKTVAKKTGRKPRVSKQDLKSFFEMASGGQEDVELEDAIIILSRALSLLKSSTSKGDSQGEDCADIGGCGNRHEEFLEFVRLRMVYSAVKWFLAGGLVTVAGIVFFFYSNVWNPLSEARNQRNLIKQMVSENRKILKLMGKQQGWEIKDPEIGKDPELGYKTPWELGLDKKKKDTKDEKNKGTPPR